MWGNGGLGRGPAACGTPGNEIAPPVAEGIAGTVMTVGGGLGEMGFADGTGAPVNWMPLQRFASSAYCPFGSNEKPCFTIDKHVSSCFWNRISFTNCSHLRLVPLSGTTSAIVPPVLVKPPAKPGVDESLR